MRHTTRWLWIAAVLCAAGCDQPANRAAPPTASATDQAPVVLELIEIQLNWFPEAEHGGYYAALVHGYFQEEGLGVTIKPGGPNMPLMESVATNRIAFGVDNADKLLRARAEEADVVAVFAPIQTSPRCIMVHAESGIKQLDDLQTAEGVTLAWNNAQPFAQFLSKKYDLSKLQMTKYSGSVGPFLLDKKYAQQAYNISEPYLAKKEGADPVSLLLSEAGFNTYTSLLLTSQANVISKPDLIRRVVRASQRGWQKYLTDAEETNRKIAELNPEMPVDVLAFGAAELKVLCQPDGLPDDRLGTMAPARWQTLADQLVEIGTVDSGAITAEKAFTLEFLPAAK